MQSYYSQAKPKQLSAILQPYLQKSFEVIDLGTIEKIKTLQVFRDDKVYKLYAQPPINYFNHIWRYYTEKDPDYEQLLISPMAQRFNNVINDLQTEQLKIQQKPPLPLTWNNEEEIKNNKINHLKQQSFEIKKKLQQMNEHLLANEGSKSRKSVPSIAEFHNVNSEQKIKQFEQFLKKEKKQKEELKKKILQSQKKAEDQQTKKKLQQEEKMKKQRQQRKEDIIKKQRQWQEQRQKQKALRSQRNTQYINYRRSLGKRPPLFKRIENDFNLRYRQVETEERQRWLEQRKSMFEHIDEMKLQQHEKFYEKIREQKEKKRKQRIAQQQQQQKSRVKFHSSYQLQKHIDPKEEEKQLAKQKYQKIKQYKELVKEKYLPKISQEKRKQLLNLIEEVELGRKLMKKKRLENGSVIYEQLKLADPRMIGISYLEQVKEMASKMKGSGRRKSSVDNIQQSTEKRFPNYLQQLKKQPKNRKKLNLQDLSHLSYQDRVKKVQMQTDKLIETTKQKQMMLKFGKFKTSQQILACKEEIDRNYLEIVKMKMLLIKPDTPNDD